MIQELIDNNYFVVRNFISSRKAKKLSKEFKEYCEKNNVQGDPQVPDTPAKYNYLSFLEILCDKTPEVSKIIGETVLPTYCYSRVYKNGDILDRHVDRDACEISLTVHLDGDKEWEIFVETPSGKDISINLKPGDALFYLGCDAPHGRNQFEGISYTQLFLHYVRSKGAKSYAYFNNKNKSIFTKELTHLNEPTVETNKSGFSHVNHDSNLKDFIFTFDDILSPELCDLIIEEYTNDSKLEFAKIAKGTINPSTRNCYTMNISFEDVIQKNPDVRRKIDDLVFKASSVVLKDFISKYPYLTVEKDTGYNFLKYELGGFYTEHIDSFTDYPRSISCSFILNDDYEGGEFAFFDGQLKYKLRKGSAIAFPSAYMFPHEIMPVTKGTRYSIITWFI